MRCSLALHPGCQGKESAQVPTRKSPRARGTLYPHYPGPASCFQSHWTRCTPGAAPEPRAGGGRGAGRAPVAAADAHVTHSPTPSALRHGCGGCCRLGAPLLARPGAAWQRAAHQGLRAPRHHHLLQGTAHPEGAAGLSRALGKGGAAASGALRCRHVQYHGCPHRAERAPSAGGLRGGHGAAPRGERRARGMAEAPDRPRCSQ